MMWKKYKRRVLLAMSSQAFAQLNGINGKPHSIQSPSIDTHYVAVISYYAREWPSFALCNPDAYLFRLLAAKVFEGK